MKSSGSPWHRLAPEERLLFIVPVLLTLGLIGCYLLTLSIGFWP